MHTTTDTRKGMVEFYYHLGETRGVLNRHAHDAHQISVTVGGRTDIQWWTASDGDRSLHVQDGHILVNPADEPHAAAWSRAWDCIGFYLDSRQTAAVAGDLGITHEIVPVYQGHDPAIGGIARALYQEVEAEPLKCRLAAESLADFLAVRLLQGPIRESRMPGDVPRLSPAALRRVTDFVARNLDRNISVSELAAEVDLSPFHFSRRFKATLGMTPYEYVTRQRIELSKELLRRTRLPIVEIAGRAGFSNQSHLCLRFKKIVGTTPARYRGNF